MKLKFISYLQCIGIILVVAGHSLQLWNSETKLLAMRLIYSVNMPLFFFISGFLLMYTSFGVDRKKPSGRNFVANKFSRLLLPYLVLTAITFVPRALLSSFAGDPIPLTFNAFSRAFFIKDANPIVHLWYIQADLILLIICFAIMSALHGRLGKAKVLCGLGVVVVLMPYIADFSLPNVFSWLEVAKFGVFFVLGMAYCHWRESIDGFLGVGRWPFAVVAAMVWVVSLCFYAKWHIFALRGIAGTAMFVSIAQILAKRGVKFMDKLDGAYYMIYLLSWYINVGCQQLLSHWVDWPWWIHSLLSFVLGIALPLIFLRWMERHSDRPAVRRVAWLLGQRLSRK